MRRPSPAVLCLGLSKNFDEVRVLDKVELRLEQGEHVAITGVSGSGKSTLLNLVGLLDRPTRGSIELFGSRVDDAPEPNRAMIRAQDIGFVFQSFHLLRDRSVRANVEMGMLYGSVPHREWSSSADEVIDFVGLGHRRLAMASTLSGGEQQRVAVARAIVSRPRLLLCDEPTGSLDSDTSAVVLDLVDDLVSTGITVLVVTHDATVARRAHRTVAVADGAVAR